MRRATHLESIPDVCEVTGFNLQGRSPEYLIELPHGATRRSHFEATLARLTGDYAEDLREFFYVNTDVGAPECATVIAAELAGRGFGVLVVRGLLPRTFIDCNRSIENGVRGEQMTPPVPGYVSREADVETLIRMYRDYQRVAHRAYEEVCGNGGHALTLHTYAPRSVGIERIDADIVRALRQAYEPARYASWERRPAVDVISQDVEGNELAPPGLVDRVVEEYAAIGIAAARNATYRLHPETMGYVRSISFPGRVLCLEINRELLADPFTPFAEMNIGEKNAERMSLPLVRALAARTWLASEGAGR